MSGIPVPGIELSTGSAASARLMADDQLPVLRQREYGLGLFFILCVGLLWSASSVLVQCIYADLEFDSPFSVTYLSNVLLA